MSLKKKKWAVIQTLSEIVTRNGGWYVKGRVSNALMFLEALEMIRSARDYRGRRYEITQLGKDILKAHITRSLLGEDR